MNSILKFIESIRKSPTNIRFVRMGNSEAHRMRSMKLNCKKSSNSKLILWLKSINESISVGRQMANVLAYIECTQQAPRLMLSPSQSLHVCVSIACDVVVIMPFALHLHSGHTIPRHSFRFHLFSQLFVQLLILLSRTACQEEKYRITERTANTS